MRVEQHYTYDFGKLFYWAVFPIFLASKNLPTEMQNFITFNVAKETSNADQ